MVLLHTSIIILEIRIVFVIESFGFFRLDHLLPETIESHNLLFKFSLDVMAAFMFE